MTGAERDVVIVVGSVGVGVAAFLEPRVQDWCARRRTRRQTRRAHATTDTQRPDG